MRIFSSLFPPPHRLHGEQGPSRRQLLAPGMGAHQEHEIGSVSRTIMDDTLPGGPRERTIVYEAPFNRCNREKDYETDWEAFEEWSKLRVDVA